MSGSKKLRLKLRNLASWVCERHNYLSEGLIKGDALLVDPDAPFEDSALYIVEVLDRKMLRRVHKNGRRYKLVLDGEVDQVDCAYPKIGSFFPPGWGFDPMISTLKAPLPLTVTG